MLRTSFATAVYGMLQYYGVISVADLLVICNRCDLCQLTDYKAFLHRIQTELEAEQQVFFCKKLVCHKDIQNPIMMRDLQKSMVAGAYKEFSLEAYLSAGIAGIPWHDAMGELKQLLKSCSKQSDYLVDLELIRLWMELNNMQELVPLTSQCITNLALPWSPETSTYMKLMEGIRYVAEIMPRWSCKGYSYTEINSPERLTERK